MTEADFPGFAARLLKLLDTLDENNGQLNWWGFIRWAGNEDAARRQELILCDDCHIIERIENPRDRRDSDGRKHSVYAKTPYGQKLHEVLKVHDYVGPLFRIIGRNKLPSSRYETPRRVPFDEYSIENSGEGLQKNEGEEP
jgi:hypothetical protein